MSTHRFGRLVLIGAIGFAFSCTLCVYLPAQERYDPKDSVKRVPRIQEQNKPSPAPSQVGGGATAGPDYVIGPEDVLKIDVFQVSELSNLIVRVSNNGTIAVPLLGDVKASGLTPKELSERLQNEWGKTYLENPEVTVFVQEFHAKPVSVVGEVGTPGLYYLTGPRTLIDMISMAGGLGKNYGDVAGPSVFVTRPGGFVDMKTVPGMHRLGPDKIEISLRDLLYSKQSGLNIAIHPLDIISVSRADVVYVTGGGVRKPGGFILQDRDRVTVFQAIAMAEGLDSTAAKHDARIIRQSPDGSRELIPIDLSKLEKGRIQDPILTANDVLFVPDSMQKKALKRAIDSTLGTLSGMLVWGRF